MRKILFLFTSILVLGLTASAFAADLFTAEVPSTEYQTIEAALESADDYESPDVVINLSGALTLTAVIDMSTYSKITNLTINGAGSTLTSASGQRHFIISSPTVIFDKVNFTGSGGGGVQISGGSVTFSGGCNFTSNTTTSAGGAISLTGGSLQIDGDNKFENNSATSNGGAVYIGTGSVTFSGANTFYGNTSTSGSGGAVYAASGTTASFSGAVDFSSTNSAGTSGGAVYSEGTVNFTGAASFASNTATSDGGAIYSSGTLTFSSTSTFTSNTANSDGGALYIAGGSVTFSGTPEFTGNTATADGGALYMASGTQVTLSSGSKFTGTNTASGGGAAYINGTLTVSGTNEFTGNTAVDGGALYIDTAGIFEDNSTTLTFANNLSSAYDASKSEASPPSGCGGSIYTAGTLTFNSDIAFNNSKAPSGGAIYVASGTTTFNGTASFGATTANEAYNGGALYLAGGTTTFSDTAAFTKNKALNSGGAIYTEDISNNGLVFNEAVTFSSNIANTDKGETGNGGAIYWGARAGYFASVFKVSASFSANSTDSQTTANDSASNGGALYFAGRGTVTIDGSIFTFDNNTAYNSGGAIYAASADIVITGIDITIKNEATNGGGGFAAAIGGKITVSDSTFSNQVADDGGVLYAENMDITSADFTSNKSTGSNSGNGGGAIFAFYEGSTGKLKINNVTFSENTANANGGAVFADTATVEMENVFFSKNNAVLNGGGANIGGTSTTNIKYATFSENESTNGGALCSKGTARVELSYFTSNHASRLGGAIHYDQYNAGGQFYLTSSMLRENAAGKGNGGAAYLRSDIAKIESCTFDRNTAEGDSEPRGGAVYMYIASTNNDDDGLVRNSTFTRNQVQNGTSSSCGGGLAIDGAAVTVTSCAFTRSNTATTYGGGIFIGDNAILYISGTIAVGNGATIGGDVYKGNGASRTSRNYNRIGIYGTGGRNTGWIADNGMNRDKENTAWTHKDFYQDNDLDVNEESSTQPPYIGASRGTEQLRLLTMMLNELESMATDDRATNNILWSDRFNFPQYDERGVDRRTAQTNLDIGPVYFKGTIPGGDGNTILNYTISKITISGIPNSLKGIGQTASLLAIIRYTNGRSAYAGNSTGMEQVTWESLPKGNHVIRITNDGVITSIGEGTAYVTVTTNRTKSDGTQASDSRAVKVDYSAILNLAPEFFEDFYKFLEELYEYDMSVSLADPNITAISSTGFQDSFKSKWNTSASAVRDMSEVYPDFSLVQTSKYTANTSLYLAAAKAQRPGINVSLPERTAGDLLALNYAWNLKGADIKSLLGEDYVLGDVSAQLASDLFTAISINFTTASGKNINVVNADNAKDLFNSKALVLTKSDSNNGVHIELTAYLARADYSDKNNEPQLVNNLLIVPDTSGSESETITGTMWLAQGTSYNNTDGGNDDSNDDNSSGSGGGGGGCNSLALGIFAAGLLFSLKRR